jgi:hypothetical protein
VASEPDTQAPPDQEEAAALLPWPSEVRVVDFLAHIREPRKKLPKSRQKRQKGKLTRKKKTRPTLEQGKTEKTKDRNLT